MTATERRLRAGMAPVDGAHPGADGWDRVERGVRRRRRTRRMVERSALVICSALVVAVGAMVTTSGGRGQTSPAADGTSRAGELGLWLVATARLVVLAVLVAVVVGAVSAVRGRPAGTSAATAIRRAARQAQRPLVTAVLLGLAVWAPTRHYVAHLDETDDLTTRMPDLSAIGTVDVDPSLSPVLPDTGAAVTVTLTPRPGLDPGRAAEETEAALAALGYEDTPGADRDLRNVRPGGASDYRLGYDRAAVTIDGDVVVITHGRVGGGSRASLPVALFISTIFIGAIALGSVQAARLEAVAATLGVAVVALTAAQAGLLIRAMWKADRLIDAHVAANGRPESWYDSSAETEALAVVKQQVVHLTGPLYPFGSLSMILLLVPWLMGVAALPRLSLRSRLVLAALAVGACVVVMVGSVGTDAIVLEILE